MNFRKRPIGTPDGEAASKRTAKAEDFAHAAVMAERVGMAERVAAAARKPDLPKFVPPETMIRLVLPQKQRTHRPPIARRNKSGSATAPSDAAGTAQQKDENIVMPELPPQNVVDLTDTTARLPSPRTKPPVVLVIGRLYFHKKLGNVKYVDQKMGSFK